jgi:hypothetical protein
MLKNFEIDLKLFNLYAIGLYLEESFIEGFARSEN